MKRLLIILTLCIMSLGASAAELGLALEKLFDGRYDSNSKVEWSKIKRNGTISYYLDFNNDPAILKEVKAALKKDMNGEEFDTEIISKGDTYYKTTISRNGYKIEISLNIPKRGHCTLIIRSKRETQDTDKPSKSPVIIYN